MKNYNDVKTAAEAALRGLMKTIYSNLDEKEADKLVLELSMSMYTRTINFDLPLDQFQKEVNKQNLNYQLTLMDVITSTKIKIDAGGYNDFKTI